MNVSAKNLLRNIVEKFGTDLTKSPGLCDAYLSDLMPAYPEERNLLVHAVAEGVPAQLLVNNSARNQSLIADRFANIYLIPEAEARQVIDTWSFALKKEFDRIHQNKDRHAARHYLGGVLTGLIVLGVSSAIAVYQVPGGSNGQVLDGSSLHDATQNALVEVASPPVKPDLDAGSQMEGIITLEPVNNSKVSDPVSSIQNNIVSVLTPSSENHQLPDNDGHEIEDQYISESLLDFYKDLPYEPDNTIEIQGFAGSSLSANNFAKMQGQVANAFKISYAIPQLIGVEDLAGYKKQLSEKMQLRKKEIADAEQRRQVRTSKMQESRRRAAVEMKLAQQRQLAEVAAMKKSEAAWLQERAEQVALKEKEAEKARLQKEILEAKKVAEAELERKKAERAEQQRAKRILERKQAEAAALKRVKEEKKKRLALAAQQKKELEQAEALKRLQEEKKKRLALAAQQKKELEHKRKQTEALARAKAEQALARQQADKAAQKKVAAGIASKKAQEAKIRQARLAAKRAANLRQQQAKANQARQQQAAKASQQTVIKVQGIARQLMGNSITFGQTSVLLKKKQADLGVLKNLLKLTKEDFYLQQQRQVNSKISSLRKKQDALSARYIQHLQQLCSLPAASMQAGVRLLSPAYTGKQGVKAVAFRMLRQHTARCSHVKRLQNHTLVRELSLAYGRVLTNP